MQRPLELASLPTQSLLHLPLIVIESSHQNYREKSMFIHRVNDIDWLVITAFEEFKTMFIEEAGAIPLASQPPARIDPD